MLSALVVGSDDPPDDAEYHSTPVPDPVDRLATVGLAALQNPCAAVIVGAPGLVVTVTATAVLVADSQPLTV